MTTVVAAPVEVVVAVVAAVKNSQTELYVLATWIWRLADRALLYLGLGDRQTRSVRQVSEFTELIHEWAMMGRGMAARLWSVLRPARAWLVNVVGKKLTA